MNIQDMPEKIYVHESDSKDVPFWGVRCSLNQSDISYVREDIVEEYRKDAERFRALEQLAKEQFLRPERVGGEFPDLRTHWVLPIIMCSGPIGGYTKFGDAVDILINSENDMEII